MKELKTLKDLATVNGFVSGYKLKAEAVKKYKAIMHNTFHIKMSPFEALKVMEFIKWDNNLTEEDLKEKVLLMVGA